MDLIKTKIENLLYKKFYNDEKRTLEIVHEGNLYEGKQPSSISFEMLCPHYIFDVTLST